MFKKHKCFSFIAWRHVYTRRRIPNSYCWFFFFSFLHKLLFCAKNPFCALGNYRDQVRIIKVGANVRREQLQQPGSCFRMPFNSKQNHPCRFYTPTPSYSFLPCCPSGMGSWEGMSCSDGPEDFLLGRDGSKVGGAVGESLLSVVMTSSTLSMLPRRGFFDLWQCAVITEEENKKYLLNSFFFFLLSSFPPVPRREE